jgi:hypothetical protein
MLRTHTEIPIYSPSRNTMYVVVKPAPRNPCYTGGPGDANVANGEFGMAGLGYDARDSLELVRCPRRGEKKRKSMRKCFQKWLRKYL